MFRSLRIMLVSSDTNISRFATSLFQNEGHEVVCVANAREAIASRCEDGEYEAVLFDTSHQSPSDLYLLKKLSETRNRDTIWIVSPLGMNQWTSEAERLGLVNCIRKPLQRHDLDHFLNRVADYHSSHSGSVQTRCATQAKSIDPLEELPGGRFFYAGCPAMKAIYDTVLLLAPVGVPVLILGESGVGKDIVANLLHKHSLRSQQSYVGVNCAALPSDLLESELFGYDAGAFTGAVKSKPGKFELAHKGTILLDEIGEMSPPMQAKLLHVLQDGRFCRLGARSSTEVDVRVIAATNVDIDSAIADGRFREDLFYRISAFTIEIPPLRERREELPFFVDEMLRRHCITIRKTPPTVPPGLMAAIQEYDWPGNLRELSNVVMRMLIIDDPEATLAYLSTRCRARHDKCNGSRIVPAVQQLASAATSNDAGGSMPSIVQGMKGQTESRLIQVALDASGWNRRHAAVQLGISYRTLLYKIQRYNLVAPRSSLQFR